MNIFRCLASAALIQGFCAFNSAGETNAAVVPKKPVPVPSTASSNNPVSFTVQKGFSIQLVAVEPMVVAPMAMAFDEKGRLFVAELPNLASRPNENPQLGQIRLLEDTDGDGIFDSSSVYADNLPWPSGLACYGGGVFVAASADIYFFKDTHGDGVADVRQEIFSGFGAASGRFNIEALVNSFAWGLDNRIHGGAAGLGGTIAPVRAAGAPKVELAHNDFWFDPRTLTLGLEPGAAQSGLCFDNRGREFISDLAHPLRMLMYDARYGWRNPFFPRAPEISSVAGIQPLLARPASSGATPNTSNTAASNSRTARVLGLEFPRGTVIYRGSAFPANYSGNVFIADPTARVIRRAALREQGLQVVAERPESQFSDFLVSSDPTFEPMQIINGPDGALYVADMQSGAGRGRIYRITAQGVSPAKFPMPGKASTRELVSMLAYANGWHRDTAARLIYERRDPAAGPLLTNMVNNARLPLARLHALHALDGLGGLTEAVVLKALRDPDERVREHATQLSERFAKNGNLPDSLWNQLASLSADPVMRVRYQLAFTLGEIRRADRALTMTGILRSDLADPWIRSAILSSVAQGAGDLFVTLAADPRFRTDAAGQQFLRDLALMIGVKGRSEEVNQVVAFFAGTTLERQAAFALVGSLGEGLRRTRSSLTLVDPQGTLQGIFTLALATCGNDPDLKVREDAIRVLGVSSSSLSEVSDVLFLLIGTGELQEIQSAAIAAVGHFRDPGATNLLSRWSALSPVSRNEALTALLAYNERIPVALAAVQGGVVARSDFSSTQMNFLRTHPNPAVSQEALRLFGPLRKGRSEVVQQFLPALHLPALALRGREIFVARCASCHKLDGEGGGVGPDLAEARLGGKEKILAAILEPNNVLRTDYPTVVLETKASENLVAVKSEENPNTVTLTQPNRAPAVWPRSNIQSMTTQSWSFMPEGLEQGLQPQAMADLLEYIVSRGTAR